MTRRPALFQEERSISLGMVLGNPVFTSKTIELLSVPQCGEACLCLEVEVLCGSKVMVPLECLGTRLVWGSHSQ